MLDKIRIKYILILVLLFVNLVVAHAGSVIYTKSGSPHYIENDIIITNGDSLIIEKGSTLIISSEINITTNGVIIAEGTSTDSITLIPKTENVGWGKISINCPGKTSIFSHIHIEEGTILSWYCDIHANKLTLINNQRLEWNHPIFYIRTASANIRNSFLFSNNTGEGIVVENAEYVNISDNNFNQTPDGIELINIEGGIIENNILKNLLDDAIDLNNCKNTIIKKNEIYNVADRGMEIGSENFGISENILVYRNIVKGCRQGIIVKEASSAQVINNTFYKNSVSIVSQSDNSQRSGSSVIVQNCIFSSSKDDDFENDEQSTIIIRYSISDSEILPGHSNLFDNPLFIDPDSNDFNLKYNSPCINAGNPRSAYDPDNTISDIGACYFNLDSISSITENPYTITIYPNPYTDYFNVLLPSESANNVDIKLSTLSGINIPVEIQKSSKNNYQIVPDNYLSTPSTLICTVKSDGVTISKPIVVN